MIIILSFYALLPKSIQFSRAIILGASLICFLSSLFTRSTFKFLKIGLIYDLKTSLESSTFSQLERRIPNSLNVLVIDTIANDISRELLGIEHWNKYIVDILENDISVNNKYKIELNNKTIERIKNSF